MPDMFVDPDDSRRPEGPFVGPERDVLIGFLRWQRATFELKCADLDPEQLARRAVPPSSLSLLGLIRHLAEVEQGWFRGFLAGETVEAPYSSAREPDGAFDGAVGEPVVVADAWATWRDEVEYADRYLETAPDLDFSRVEKWRGEMSLRWVLVHMIEEYARHNGHADLLREQIDGAVGQ